MTDLITNFIAAAVKSDFFAGGLALGAFGMAVAMMRSVLMMLYRLVLRRIWVSLTLDNRSEAYRHFIIWMENSAVLDKSKHVRLTDGRWVGGTKGFAPAPGRHWFTYKGKLCYLDRELNEKAKVGAAYDQRPMEVLKVTVLFGHVSTIVGWINEGKRIAKNGDRIGPGLHILKGDYWDSIGDIPRRSLDTVLVDDDRIENVVADMRWFYGAQDWYAERGVPWRRGYLFYGPPGTGKSSLIRAIASELVVDISSMDIGRATLTDDDLREAMMCAPKKSLIAIEDIDAIFSKRKKGETRSGISFSGLLNAIDGVAAQEGRALIMTTNHKEKLDAALIRPGRADVHMELGLINAMTARRLFDRFFPEQRELSERFMLTLGEERFSPAEVQSWLLSHSDSAEVASHALGLISPPRAIAAE